MTSLTFYDLENKDRTGWSPNTLKTELALRYKGLDFSTSWISYPDVAGFLQKKGVKAAPLPMKTAQYTLPTIEDHGKVIMDSWAIAEYLENQYPEKPMFKCKPLDRIVNASFMADFRDSLFLLVAYYVPPMLDARGEEYWRTTREELLGPLDAFQEPSKQKELWKKAEQAAQKWGKILKDNSSGPFLLGSEISYGDFVIAAFVHFLKRSHTETFQGLLSIEPAFKEHYEACEYLFK